jgi:hypothetical protein
MPFEDAQDYRLDLGTQLDTLEVPITPDVDPLEVVEDASDGVDSADTVDGTDLPDDHDLDSTDSEAPEDLTEVDGEEELEQDIDIEWDFDADEELDEFDEEFDLDDFDDEEDLDDFDDEEELEENQPPTLQIVNVSQASSLWDVELAVSDPDGIDDLSHFEVTPLFLENGGLLLSNPLPSVSIVSDPSNFSAPIHLQLAPSQPFSKLLWVKLSLFDIKGAVASAPAILGEAGLHAIIVDCAAINPVVPVFDNLEAAVAHIESLGNPRVYIGMTQATCSHTTPIELPCSTQIVGGLTADWTRSDPLIPTELHQPLSFHSNGVYDGPLRLDALSILPDAPSGNSSLAIHTCHGTLNTLTLGQNPSTPPAFLAQHSNLEAGRIDFQVAGGLDAALIQGGELQLIDPDFILAVAQSATTLLRVEQGALVTMNGVAGVAHAIYALAVVNGLDSRLEVRGTLPPPDPAAPTAFNQYTWTPSEALFVLLEHGSLLLENTRAGVTGAPVIRGIASGTVEFIESTVASRDADAALLIDTAPIPKVQSSYDCSAQFFDLSIVDSVIHVVPSTMSDSAVQALRNAAMEPAPSLCMVRSAVVAPPNSGAVRGEGVVLMHNSYLKGQVSLNVGAVQVLSHNQIKASSNCISLQGGNPNSLSILSNVLLSENNQATISAVGTLTTPEVRNNAIGSTNLASFCQNTTNCTNNGYNFSLDGCLRHGELWSCPNLGLELCSPGEAPWRLPADDILHTPRPWTDCCANPDTCGAARADVGALETSF